MIIVITILWIAYSLLEGFREAHYYDTHPNHKNIHWVYFIQRGVVLAGAFGSLTIPYIESGLVCFSLVLIFSFFHNGAYYQTRHYLNKSVYPKGFFSNSDTSQAVFEFSFWWRTSMAIFGFLLLFYI